VPADEVLAASAVARARPLLRARGERMTRPRQAVIEVLAARTDHLTADEVGALLAAEAADVHLATVYRALESLSRVGVVQHVHVPNGATKYHLTPPLTGHDHVHAQCRLCERVIDLPAALLDDVAAALLARHGFRLDAGHVALSGTCADCASRDGVAREG
jgi:Fur family ferric uptake transcriptional regulator